MDCLGGCTTAAYMDQKFDTVEHKEKAPYQSEVGKPAFNVQQVMVEGCDDIKKKQIQ